MKLMICIVCWLFTCCLNPVQAESLPPYTYFFWQTKDESSPNSRTVSLYEGLTPISEWKIEGRIQQTAILRAGTPSTPIYYLLNDSGHLFKAEATKIQNISKKNNLQFSAITTINEYYLLALTSDQNLWIISQFDFEKPMLVAHQDLLQHYFSEKVVRLHWTSQNLLLLQTTRELGVLEIDPITSVMRLHSYFQFKPPWVLKEFDHTTIQVHHIEQSLGKHENIWFIATASNEESPETRFQTLIEMDLRSNAVQSVHRLPEKKEDVQLLAILQNDSAVLRTGNQFAYFKRAAAVEHQSFHFLRPLHEMSPAPQVFIDFPHTSHHPWNRRSSHYFRVGSHAPFHNILENFEDFSTLTHHSFKQAPREPRTKQEFVEYYSRVLRHFHVDPHRLLLSDFAQLLNRTDVPRYMLEDVPIQSLKWFGLLVKGGWVETIRPHEPFNLLAFAELLSRNQTQNQRNKCASILGQIDI